MATYYSLRDGLITDTSTYGMSISSVEKTTNTTAYTLTTSDSWSTVLSSATTDVIDSIAVHLSSRAANPVGVLSAETSQYAGILTKTGTSLSTASPFTGGRDGSIRFNGTSEYVTIPAGSHINLGTGDFTIEMWVNTTNISLDNNGGRNLFSFGTSTSNQLAITLRTGTVGSAASTSVTSKASVYSNVYLIAGTIDVADGNWNHICLLRDGTSMRLYVNGLQSGETATNSVNYNAGATLPMNLGTYNATIGNFDGLISNFRVVIGSAIVPSIPLPDSPLTPVTNTTLLYQFPYTNAYKNSNVFLNTLVGTYPVSSFTSYDGSNNTLATYPLNWQLLKLSAPFANSSGYFSFNLKTSNANQLSLMGVSTVNGVDYDRMAIADNISFTDLSGSLTKTGTTLSSASPFGEGTDGSILFDGSSEIRTTNSTEYSLIGAYTLELWVNVRGVGGVGGSGMISHQNGGTSNLVGWVIGQDYTANSFYFNYNTNSTTVPFNIQILPVGSTLNLNQWYHIAITSDGSTIRSFVDGVLTNSKTYYAMGLNNFPLTLGDWNYASQTRRLDGYLSNVRIIKGKCLYTGNFTRPILPFNTYPKIDGYTPFLYKSPYSTQYLYNKTSELLPNDIHLASVLSGYTTQSRAITSDSSFLENIYIHKNATVSFPSTSSCSLFVDGTNGIQITSEGTLEIGTSTNSVPLSTTHQIILSNNHIGVSNGGRLDVYGAYKVPYTKLTTPSLSTARTFTVVDNVSSNWQVNDTVVFTPNTAQSTSYDTLVLSSFDSDNTFRTTTSAAFAHTVLDYVPNVANLTRNVKIGGASNTARGYVAAIGGATVNINNAEFKFIDTGLTTGVDSNGLFTVSGCTLSGNGTETLLSPLATEFSTVFNKTSLSFVEGPANNTDFDVNVGTDFTLEVFVKLNSSTTSNYIISIANPSIAGSSPYDDYSIYLIIYPTTRAVSFQQFLSRSAVGKITEGYLLALNKWHHIAVVARNSNVKIYIDGKEKGSCNQITWNFSSSYITKIGRFDSFNNANPKTYFDGKMSNLRFVRGQAMYTGNFTPPNAPLTEIIGDGVKTAILTFQNETVRDNSYRNAALTTNNITTELDSPFGKSTINASINDNVVFKPSYGLSLDNVASNNTSITKNLLLSSKDAGIYVNDGLKGDLTFNSNIAVGPSPYGSLVQNNTTGTTLSSIVNYNNTTGMFINNAHAGRIDNVINTHNSTIGVLVDGTINQLNETTFTNITASNNRTLGFRVSGNPVDHLSPITLNINRLVANNNLSGGFEGYCITGNLTALELNRNGIYGMKTSIGNYYTTIDGITALMNNVASTSAGIGILSGLNYYPTVIKDANIDGANKSGISLDSTNLSQFYVYNSTVSGAASDFNIIASRNVLEGSYLISNTNVGPLPIGIGITSNNYQSDVLKTTGFAFTNMNNASGFNVTYLAAGNRSADSTITNNIGTETAPSERLTPQSTSLKLRSGSKFVALDANQSTTVAVYVQKSPDYNGNAPRLVLKRNGAMGINKDLVMDQLFVLDGFQKLFGTTTTVTDAGVLEFYVDCDGTTGWINIDNWTAN